MDKQYLIFDGASVFNIYTSTLGKTRGEIHARIVKLLNKMSQNQEFSPIKPHELELIIPEPNEVRYLHIKFDPEYAKMVQVSNLKSVMKGSTKKENLTLNENTIDFIVIIGETEFISKVPYNFNDTTVEDDLFQMIHSEFNQREINREKFIKIEVPKGKTIVAIQKISSGTLI